MSRHEPPAAILNDAVQGISTPLAPPAPAHPNNPIRILVVDDKPDPLVVLQTLLRELGFAADTALGGQAALTALGERHYDIMLLDLMMPDVDGHAVLDFCRRRAVDVKTIVVSGDSSFDGARHALQCGAFDYVHKPYATSALLAVIRRAVRERTLEQENRRITARLRDSEELHRFIVNTSPDLVYMLDAEGRFTFLNDRVESLLGYAKNALLGTHYDVLVDPADRDHAHHVIHERRTGARASNNVEMRLRPLASGSGHGAHEPNPLWVEVTATGLYASPDDARSPLFIGSYGSIRDITARKLAEASISFQAYHDTLTGLPNRALLHDRLELAIAHAARNASRLAVIFLDLDRFKPVNDNLGHSVGDQLLQAVAARLTACLRRGDTLARYGGDEFALVLPDLASDEAARIIARKVLDCLARPFLLEGHALSVGSSIGIATYPEAGTTRDELIRSADAAMYEVKSTGRNDYRFFDPGTHRARLPRRSRYDDLERAIARDEITVDCQPRVCLLSGRITGVEASARWHDPQHRLPSAAEFLDAAELGELNAILDRHVLRHALADTARWLHESPGAGRVALRLSTTTLSHDGHIDALLETVDQAGVDRGAIMLGIAERDLDRQRELILPRLRRIHAAGLKLAIDAFGTGGCGLTIFEQTPVDALILDRAFTAMIRADGKPARTADAVLGVAGALSLPLIADGVEHRYQLEYLVARGCQVAQGGLLFAPMPGHEVARVLAADPVLARMTGEPG